MKSIYRSYRTAAVLAVSFVMAFCAASCSSDDQGETSSSEVTASEVTATETAAEAATSETTADTSAATVLPDVPEGIVGRWQCEELASDGKTDTSFYAMYVRTDGFFDMYDVAAGNPGISGYMSGNDGSSVLCRFNMDDFDVPACWTIDSSEDKLQYELIGDTMKLGHNDVWMTFRLTEAPKQYDDLPKSVDELITFDLPGDAEPDTDYYYDDDSLNPVVARAYNSEKNGFLYAGIFSHNGKDCLYDISENADLDAAVKALNNMREITAGGEKGYLGTMESDDMPDMTAVFYVQHGDYVFEFRLSNYDEQITDAQMKAFEQLIGSVSFK